MDKFHTDSVAEQDDIHCQHKNTQPVADNDTDNDVDIEGLTPEMLAFISAQQLRFMQEDQLRAANTRTTEPELLPEEEQEMRSCTLSAQRKNKLAKRFKKKTKNTCAVEVQKFTHRYMSRSGVELELSVLDSIATLYYLEDQPNEPQITANAHTRAGGGSSSSLMNE